MVLFRRAYLLLINDSSFACATCERYDMSQLSCTGNQITFGKKTEGKNHETVFLLKTVKFTKWIFDIYKAY